MDSWLTLFAFLEHSLGSVKSDDASEAIIMDVFTNKSSTATHIEDIDISDIFSNQIVAFGG